MTERFKMQTVNEHAIIVSLKSVFIAYDYLRKITKTNRGRYAISTIRRYELDRSTELYRNVWPFDFILAWYP